MSDADRCKAASVALRPTIVASPPPHEGTDEGRKTIAIGAKHGHAEEKSRVSEEGE